MTREEYLNELKSSLLSLSQDEQAEAIQYYSDYFEEADDDQKVIGELGSPEELAKTITEKFANALVHQNKEGSADNSDQENRAEESGDSSIDALYFSFDKNQIKNLSFDFGAAEVVMIEGDDFSVETRGIQKDFLSCYVNYEQTLFICNSRRFNLNFWSHDRRSRLVPRILLTLPKNLCLDRVNINVGAGQLTSRPLSLKCKSGNITVGAGNIVLNGIFGGRIDLRCNMGNIEMKGSLSGAVNIDCGMGNLSLDLKGKASEYSYDAKIGLGDFRFNDEKKSGVCQIYNKQKMENHFSVNVGMGSVKIKLSE